MPWALKGFMVVNVLERVIVEGEMLLELASALGLVVVNTCFTKRES